MEQTGFTQGSDANTTTQQTPFVLTEKHIEFLTSIEEWLENEDEMLSLIYDGSVIDDGETEELDEEELARLERQYGLVCNIFSQFNIHRMKTMTMMTRKMKHTFNT